MASAVNQRSIGVVNIVESTNSGRFPKTAVATTSNFVVLPAKVERFEEQEDRDLGEREEKQGNLDILLTRIQQ